MENNTGNSNQNTPDTDGFQKMLDLAGFGVKRMEERRAFEFRIFISYTTLLVLALYQLLKQNPISLKSLIYQLTAQDPPPPISPIEGIALYVLVLGIHIVYVLWQVGVGIAMENDAYRRNFYLKKAECLSGKRLEYEDKKPKVKRKIIIIQHYLQQLRYLWIIWEDWSRLLLVVIPTILFMIVVHLFIKKTYPEWDGCVFAINVLVFGVLIGVSGIQSICRKKDSPKS